MTTIGFIGLGQMGAAMSRNLLKGGFALRAYDISRAAVDALARDGAMAVASPKEAAAGADLVITMVPNGPDVEAVVFGADGIAEAIGKQALYIDMSTILPATTDRVGERLAARGIAMVDAPVGRTSTAAIAGKLLIMAGGKKEDIERARPAFERMGDTIIHCGPLGAGSRLKLVNNYLSIVCNVATAEALTLAEANGLDTDLVVEVLRGTTAGRGHLNTTYPAKVLKGDVTPEFMLDLAYKDLGLALEAAAAINVPLATGAAARQIYALARTQGRGRQDWTAMLRAMRVLAGRKES